MCFYLCPWTTVTHSKSFAAVISQTQIVLSRPHVVSRVPVAFQATLLTSLSWPCAHTITKYDDRDLPCEALPDPPEPDLELSHDLPSHRQGVFAAALRARKT